MIPLADRTRLLQPSPTLAITARAKELKAAGEDIISFAAGEPDFNTPEPICKRAEAAIEAGKTKYSPTPGIPELRQAIVEKLARENGLNMTPQQTLVSVGAKQALYSALSCIVNPGDEVILIAPFWPTYADQVSIVGGTPVVMQTTLENGFRPTMEDIQAKITSKTRAIMINSPSNPTGAALSRQDLKNIAALAIRHGFWVISDEIYERLSYGHQHVSIASLGSEIAEQTVTITGCSKTYSMTGWRIGFAAGPLEIIKKMSCMQDQLTSGATTFAQEGAVAALEMPDQDVEAMRLEFEGRRNMILGLLREIPGIKVHDPEGAFYVFPDITHYLGDEMVDDSALCEHLLMKAKIACVPGSSFFSPGHLRFSYAASRENIQAGMARLAEALCELK